MLYAAMLSIGARYSTYVCDRQATEKLHKTRTNWLDHRDPSNLSSSDRFCDIQNIFLVELFTRCCAQRCAMTLSSRFVKMHEKLVGMHGLHPSAILGPTSLVPIPEGQVQNLSMQWVDLSEKQHLLPSYYVLHSRQSTLLARDHEPSLLLPSHDLPFTAHRPIWDVTSPHKWIVAVQQHQDGAKTVPEALNGSNAGRYDSFQSTVLIAAPCTHSTGSASRANRDIENILHVSPPNLCQSWTVRLTQIVPMRALLAVSSEAWMPGTKVALGPVSSALRAELQTWIGQLWS